MVDIEQMARLVRCNVQLPSEHLHFATEAVRFPHSPGESLVGQFFGPGLDSQARKINP